MAVGAHHLHLGEIMNALEIYNDAPQTSPLAPPISIPFYNFDDSHGVSAPRKRPREQVGFLGEDVSLQIQQQLLEIDRIIANHAEKVRAEMGERRRRMTKRIAEAVEEVVARRLRAKEEEIERIVRLNWALEERIKSLCVENQIWRDLARGSEAAANALRCDLEQALAGAAAVAAAVAEEEEKDKGVAVDDAGSCYDGGGGGEGWNGRWCRRCGEKEAEVLLMPCRHLCVCAACGGDVQVCPVCECGKDGFFVVNLS